MPPTTLNQSARNTKPLGQLASRASNTTPPLNSTRYLWFAWKDWTHPGAGGAEVVLHELTKRQAAAGHEVTIVTAQHAGSTATETLDGVHIIRLKGNRYIQPFVALKYYLGNLRDKYDVIIETVNTAPYFSPLFAGKARSFLFYHQMADLVWKYETPPPVSFIGRYILEPGASRLLAASKAPVITISESTKRDLQRYGFKADRISIISEGLVTQPVRHLGIKKFERPTVLSLGAMRVMKNTLDIVRAFEIAKRDQPDLQLKLAGDSTGKYGEAVLAAIQSSRFSSSIEYLGRVSNEDRLQLMQRSHIFLQSSVKEGWGLTVTEANSQGTPAVVYDNDGLRDSVRDGQTGLVVATTPVAMAAGITQLLASSETYERMRRAAWEWSQTITFDQSYADLTTIIEA